MQFFFQSVATVPTPFFLSLSPSTLSTVSFRSLIAFSKPTTPFRSTTSPRNHSFSVSSWLTRFSSSFALSPNSFAVRSSACSRCFFLTRKRADAAVFRRRLSSSAAKWDVVGEVGLLGLVVGVFNGGAFFWLTFEGVGGVGKAKTGGEVVPA